MSPKTIDKVQKRNAIVRAAMRSAARKGINNIKIDDIAEEAGIGKGTIYEYFSSKEEMFGEAIVEFMRHMETTMAGKMFKALTPPDKIKAIIDSFVEVCESEDRELMHLMTDVWAEGIRQDSEELKKVFDLKEVYRQFGAMVAAIINDGINSGIFRQVDTETVAGVFLATTDGLIIQWLLDKDNFDLRKAADMLYETLLHGISTE
ncbi:TetR/AcrR family transcriptional regulator [candidate division KSB1 bacterium]